MALTPSVFSAGNMINGDPVSAVSVPNATLSTVASLNLKGGHTYILTGGCGWTDSVSNQNIQLRLNGRVYRFPDAMAGGGGCGASVLEHINSDVTATMQIYQASGQARTASVYFRAMPLD